MKKATTTAFGRTNTTGCLLSTLSLRIPSSKSKHDSPPIRPGQPCDRRATTGSRSNRSPNNSTHDPAARNMASTLLPIGDEPHVVACSVTSFLGKKPRARQRKRNPGARRHNVCLPDHPDAAIYSSVPQTGDHQRRIRERKLTGTTYYEYTTTQGRGQGRFSDPIPVLRAGPHPPPPGNGRQRPCRPLPEAQRASFPHPPSPSIVKAASLTRRQARHSWSIVE